jgi:hypothetical protein
MKARHPRACPFVVYHLVSWENFADICIVSGYSLAAAKTKLLQTRVLLLGDWCSREGRSPDPDNISLIRDWPPIREETHLRRFLGMTNWLRCHYGAEYAEMIRPLTKYFKKGTDWDKFEDDEAVAKAVTQLKTTICAEVLLSVLDDIAAVDGSLPAESIADSSGYAWGGTLVQMTPDLVGFRVIAHASGTLNPSQQAWPTRTQELYAQLNAKRAWRKIIGPLPTVGWGDHHNVARLLTEADIDVKHLRWLAEIQGDGSDLRSMSGRSAFLKLADGPSRDHPERDRLLAERTMDLHRRAERIRNFSVADYHDDYEDDSIQAGTLAKDAIPPCYEVGALWSEL